MGLNVTPIFILLAAAMLAAAGLVFAVYLAVDQPFLGVTLAADPESRLASIIATDAEGPARNLPEGGVLAALGDGSGNAITLSATDLVEDPDSFASYADYNTFLARHDRIHALLAGSEVQATIGAPFAIQTTVTLYPRPMRPLSALPATFWVQVFVAVSAFLIGIWVWSLKTRDWGAFFFALSGFGVFLGALSAAVYGTRELAMTGTLLDLLSSLNYVGATLIVPGIISLFLAYPVRLVPERWLFLPLIVFGGWMLADTFRLFPSLVLGRRIPGIVLLVVTVFVIALQYRASRHDPRHRMAVRWFGLSVAIGIGAFILMIVVPVLIGAQTPVSQGYAVLFFLIIYVGAALGILRYRLFDLEEWAFRILFYFSAVLLLLAFDAALIFLVSFERLPAFSMSLIAVAFIYLPFRDVLARRFLGQRAMDREALFGQIVDVALTPPGESQGIRWQELLKRVFNPLRIENAEGIEHCAVDDEGGALLVSGTEGIGAFRLEYANGGRRLFNSRDAVLADELTSMLNHAVQSRHAYERGVAEERTRIARDMHDNIGAQLLGALHSREVDRKDTMIRESLSDLRGIVNNASRPGLSLDETLADLRVETAERLSAAGIALDWQMGSDETPFLAPHAAHALRSITREAVSNVIRHSGAKSLAIAIASDGKRIRLTIEDDGRGFDTDAIRTGNGLANMAARAAGLGGAVDISSSETGTILAAQVPISKSSAAASNII